MGTAQPAERPPLTPEQKAFAEDLFIQLDEARRSGDRMAIIHLDDNWGVRRVSKRVEVKRLQDYGRITPR